MRLDIRRAARRPARPGTRRSCSRRRWPRGSASARKRRRAWALFAKRRGVHLLQPRERVLAVDSHLLAALLRRLEHHVATHLLEDAAQRARAELLLVRILDDRPQRALLKVEL